MGKISKPQKSKKHKKIKAVDPFYFGERKISGKAAEYNQKPKNIEEQEVPHSLRELVTSGKVQKRRKKKNKFASFNEKPERFQKGMTRPLKPVPQFSKRKGETYNDFVRRVETETWNVLQRSKLEDKYGVQFETTEKGEIKVKKKEKSEEKREKIKNRKKDRAAKKMTKKLEKKQDDFGEFSDKIEFNEVAMEPPKLTAKPRKSEVVETKPGKKSLLLKEIIRENLNQHEKSVNRGVGQTEKRKHMSLAKRQQMDSQRERAISLYRQLKDKKLKETR